MEVENSIWGNGINGDVCCADRAEWSERVTFKTDVLTREVDANRVGPTCVNIFALTKPLLHSPKDPNVDAATTHTINARRHPIPAGTQLICPAATHYKLAHTHYKLATSTSPLAKALVVMLLHLIIFFLMGLSLDS